MTETPFVIVKVPNDAAPDEYVDLVKSLAEQGLKLEVCIPTPDTNVLVFNPVTEPLTVAQDIMYDSGALPPNIQ